MSLIPEGTFTTLLNNMKGVSEPNRDRLAALEEKGDWNGVAQFWPRSAVDHAHGHVKQKIDQPRRLAPVEQVAQQLVLLRANAGKGRDGSKQGIEQSRAHGRLTLATAEAI